MAAEANVVAYIAQCTASVTENNAVLRFIVFFIGIQPRVMAHAVADLVVVENHVVILGGQPVGFAAQILPDQHRVLGVVADVGIVVPAAGALGAALFLDGLVDHRAVPGLAPLSGQDSEERDNQKHAADAEADEQRLWVAHALGARLAGNGKADDGGDGQNHREDARPAVGIFNVFFKGRVADTGRESTQTRVLRHVWGCLIDSAATSGAKTCAF
ncbi:hypothetical protein SDC9_166028 [bioreactor metagenome]|uniref:Uncharacterized protein n=1 Tax=bioreactor metagenome TaxID=1076179 RepID=A0A645FW38_9ZZZZ